jgi:site-specific DNA-adenine methylase
MDFFLYNKEYLKSPFNYTGTKYFELQELLTLFPKDKTKIIDLFVGGGSVFINSDFKNVVINDVIKDLTDFYNEMLTKSFDEIVWNIHEYIFDKDDQESYLKLRESYNKEPNCYKFFVLCASCTNNMMRFNKKFKFNQTFGKRMVNDKIINKLELFYHKIREFDSVEIINRIADAIDDYHEKYKNLFEN